MKRAFYIASLLAGLAFGLPAALADPGGPNLQQPVFLTCTNGIPATVNPGTLTNRGRVAWDANSARVFVTAELAFSDGTNTFVIFDSKKG